MARFRLFHSRRNRRSAAAPLSGTRQSASSARKAAAPQKMDWLKVRGGIVAVLFLALWLTLWLRAGWVQIIKGPDYAESARRQHLAMEIVELPRAMITDRNGISLARSVECCSVYANPSLVEDPAKTAAALAPLIHQPKERLARALGRKRSFIWLARRVDDATAEAVRRAKLPGIALARDYERVYPYRGVAGQLLGFVGMDGKGLEGVERAYESRLAGSRSRHFVQRDALGRRFQLASAEQPDETDALALTLDLHVQFIAEDVLASTVNAERAKWGGILVVDVPTGDVLAWAQYPSFNPNRFRDATPSTYRNRLALDALEPGSTIKPLLVAGAMKEKLINSNSKFNCEQGRWATRSITIRDDTHSYGVLPVHRIVALSSNIGSAKIGLLLGAPRFQSFLANLGFGQRTGLPLAESKGILRKANEWRESDLISASFGQSISVTALQMAQAYLTLGNHGVYRPLNIVQDQDERIQDSGQRLFPAKVAREVLSIMREVVDDGTGRRAVLPGMSIAGKTGTAQKAGPHGKYGDKRMASFVGLAPAERPRYLIIVILDEPERNKYGGAIAAPAFRETLARMLSYYGELPAESKTAPVQKTARNDSAAGNGQIRLELNQTAPHQAAPADAGTAPDVIGKPVRLAVEQFARLGIVPRLQGYGAVVIRQDPAPGSAVMDAGNDVEATLWLAEDN